MVVAEINTNIKEGEYCNSLLNWRVSIIDIIVDAALNADLCDSSDECGTCKRCIWHIIVLPSVSVFISIAKERRT